MRKPKDCPADVSAPFFRACSGILKIGVLHAKPSAAQNGHRMSRKEGLCNAYLENDERSCANLVPMNIVRGPARTDRLIIDLGEKV